MLLFAGTLEAQADAPLRLDRGRFTVVHYPSDVTLAHSILDAVAARDTFPGLPRPQQHVLIAIAPDATTFHAWAGPAAPEWGAAVAFPAERRLVLQGSAAAASAGNPLEVVRHELAHLALHEYLGSLPPRWFDEGYASFAAGEVTSYDALSANIALAVRGVPSLDSLDAYFSAGSNTARAGYALATSAVQAMSALDPRNGLSRVFAAWKATGSLDQALRQADGITLAGFESDWRSAARRRFGALALMEDFTLLVLLVLVFAFPLWMARRQRDRARMAELVAADAAEDAAARAESELP